jgi:chromosome segregation ATPase
MTEATTKNELKQHVEDLKSQMEALRENYKNALLQNMELMGQVQKLRQEAEYLQEELNLARGQLDDHMLG